MQRRATHLDLPECDLYARVHLAGLGSIQQTLSARLARLEADVPDRPHRDEVVEAAGVSTEDFADALTLKEPPPALLRAVAPHLGVPTSEVDRLAGLKHSRCPVFEVKTFDPHISAILDELSAYASTTGRAAEGEPGQIKVTDYSRALPWLMALVGLCWSDPVWVLDTDYDATPPSHVKAASWEAAGYQRYGVEVWRELLRAGYSQEEAIFLGLRVRVCLIESMTSFSGWAAQVDFFGARRVTSASPS